MELGYQKIDKYDEECVAQMATHYKAILKLLGEDQRDNPNGLLDVWRY